MNKFKPIYIFNMLIIKTISRVTVALIKIHPLVKDVYFRGSFGLERFIPFYSDIDAVFIIKKTPQKDFRNLRDTLPYLRKIKKMIPLLEDSWVLFDEEMDIFKDFWYLFDTKPWRSLNGKIISPDDNFVGINLKLLLVSLWSSQIGFYKKTLADLMSPNSYADSFYPKIIKIRLLSDKLDNFIKIPKECLSFKEYISAQENSTIENIYSYFNFNQPEDIKLKLAEEIFFLLERSANWLLHKYPTKEEPEFVERPIELGASSDLLQCFKNLNFSQIQSIFSGYKGIYIVTKDGISREEANTILRIFSSSLQKRYAVYLYTPRMYLISLMHWPIKIIYRSQEFNINMSPYFLKESYIINFFYNSLYLKTCFEFDDYKDKLYNLFWGFLKTRLSLEKRYLCITQELIAQKCLDNNQLFKDYDPIIWRIFGLESGIYNKVSAQQLFSLNLKLSRDIFDFLESNS